MIPAGIIRISDNNILSPKNNTQDLKESWDSGGIELLNSTKGLFYQKWHIKTDGQRIYLKADNQTQWIEVLKDNKITEVDVTFDQNMRLHVTYVANNIAKFYYYNFYQNQFILDSFDNIRNPRISLDDKRRDIGSGNSDIIFAYVNKQTNELLYKVQRERYLNEHSTGIILKESEILWRIGMGDSDAFMFYILQNNLDEDN